AVLEGLFDLLQGRLTKAERLIPEARRIGQQAQSWNAEMSYLLQMFVLRRYQGRLAEVEELASSAAADHPGYPICRCMLAFVASELGQDAASAELLEGLAAEEFKALPFDEEWLVSTSMLAEVVVSRSDVARARLLYEKLLPYADRVAVSYPEISTGSVSRYLA